MATDRKRILIAEDNPALGHVTRFNLERAGYDVDIVRDGADAVGLLAAKRFDLLITDLQMPSMDGEVLCGHVRSVPELADLPIIVCSAKGLERDSARLMLDYGVAHLLFKPFSPSELVGIVAASIRSHSAAAAGTAV